jgi:hypothetical protein
MNKKTVLWEMQGKGNQPLKHTYAEALLLIHKEGGVTGPNKLIFFLNLFTYIFIHLLIYLFLIYLVLLSTAHTIQCQMMG